MKKQALISIDELKKKRHKILNDIKKEKQKTSVLGKIAILITEKVGSMGFFLVIFIWTASWLGWNIFAPQAVRFDPYPAFVLWLFISNMIQLFLMPLIMLGQNIQAKASDTRAEADLEINMQAALENEAILLHLENQNEMMINILKAIEAKN
jgi:uncharacterized membrane protein